MSERDYDLQGTYHCGQCKTDQFYLLSEGIESAIPCPECGWRGRERDVYDVPEEIKADLAQF